MEQHGENPINNVIAVIPARYKSVRLEGKLLLPLAGKPLVLHTVERVKMASMVERVIVATDDTRIANAVKAGGHEVQMTASGHESGTDRIAEVSASFPDSAIVVNVQADEPMIDPETVDIAVRALIDDKDADMSTCSEKMETVDDVLDPNIVKVVTSEDGVALYFSRSPVPFPRDAVIAHGDLRAALENEPELLSTFKKHTGIYVYRQGFLLKYAASLRTRLEISENLEQLRALDMGARIRVANAAACSTGVDTPEDYERIRAAFEGMAA